MLADAWPDPTQAIVGSREFNVMSHSLIKLIAEVRQCTLCAAELPAGPRPHPSPRNNLWLRRNPWFEDEIVPALRRRVATVLARAPVQPGHAAS